MLTYKEFIQKIAAADAAYMEKLDENPSSIFLTVKTQGVN